MLVSVNLATHRARKDVLPVMLESIHNQTVTPDAIRVYYNDYKPKPLEGVQQYTGEDLTDRGKFYGLRPGEVYFSCDDDLLYPKDYIEKTLEALEKYPGHIITYHGRIITAHGNNYYHGNEIRHFFLQWDDTLVDVPGTGVSAFYTDDFIPNIIGYPEQKMADVLLGLEAAKHGVPIMAASHPERWVKPLDVNESIYHDQRRICVRQTQLANQIYGLKNKANLHV